MSQDDEQSLAGRQEAGQDRTESIQSKAEVPKVVESTRQESLLPRARLGWQSLGDKSGPKSVDMAELNRQPGEKTEGEVTRERVLDLERQLKDLRGQFEATQKSQQLGSQRYDPRFGATVFPVRVTGAPGTDRTWIENTFDVAGALTDSLDGRTCSSNSDPSAFVELDTDEKVLLGIKTGEFVRYVVIAGTSGIIDFRYNIDLHCIEATYDNVTWICKVNFTACPTNSVPLSGDELRRAGGLTGDSAESKMYPSNVVVLADAAQTADYPISGALR